MYYRNLRTKLEDGKGKKGRCNTLLEKNKSKKHFFKKVKKLHGLNIISILT